MLLYLQFRGRPDHSSEPSKSGLANHQPLAGAEQAGRDYLQRQQQAQRNRRLESTYRLERRLFQ